MEPFPCQKNCCLEFTDPYRNHLRCFIYDEMNAFNRLASTNIKPLRHLGLKEHNLGIPLNFDLKCTYLEENVQMILQKKLKYSSQVKKTTTICLIIMHRIWIC